MAVFEALRQELGPFTGFVVGFGALTDPDIAQVMDQYRADQANHQAQRSLGVDKGWGAVLDASFDMQLPAA